SPCDPVRVSMKPTLAMAMTQRGQLGGILPNNRAEALSPWAMKARDEMSAPTKKPVIVAVVPHSLTPLAVLSGADVPIRSPGRQLRRTHLQPTHHECFL